MKVGDNIQFYLFGVLESGTIIKKNKNRTFTIETPNGIKYPEVKVFKRLPKRKSQIPPWYILG
jgi:hypothetical protein